MLSTTVEQKNKEYDYFNGADWVKVDEEWLEGVNLNGLTDVYRAGGDTIRCIYEGGKEVYYRDIFGTWGNPTTFH